MDIVSLQDIGSEVISSSSNNMVDHDEESASVSVPLRARPNIFIFLWQEVMCP